MILSALKRIWKSYRRAAVRGYVRGFNRRRNTDNPLFWEIRHNKGYFGFDFTTIKRLRPNYGLVLTITTKKQAVIVNGHYVCWLSPGLWHVISTLRETGPNKQKQHYIDYIRLG
jgi:hypothetical protein